MINPEVPRISVMLLVVMFLFAFTVKQMWNWFVAPIFRLQRLKLAYAIGFVLIWSMLRHDVGLFLELSPKERFGLLFDSGIQFGVTLAVGYVVSLFTDA